MDIIVDNEKAYADRYGVSLEECWDLVDDKEKKDAFERIKGFSGKKMSDGTVFNSDSLLRIVIGYPGSEILKLITRDSLPAVRVIIWEPDGAMFLAGCTVEDISRFIYDERYTIVFGHDDPECLKKAINDNLFDHNVNHISLCETGVVSHNERQYVNKFRQMLTEIVKEEMFMENMRKIFGSLPYSNYLYAIHLLNNNSTIDQLLENIPKRDIPVIIVSAGPSLKKNCEELKKAKGKALIIAVTHSMKTLAGEGIVPDMLAIIDPKDSDYMDFDNDKSYYLLCDAYSSRYDQEHYNGKNIYFGFTAYEGLFTTERIRGGINPELGSGSVATDVFSLMLEAGFKKFILVGQDLAYDGDGHTHTGDFTEESFCEKTGFYMETEGINGGLVKTRFDWDRFRKYYEKRIASLSDVQIIDATEGGALIKGTQVMTLKSAISEYCNESYPVSEWFEGLKKGTAEEREEINNWFEENIYKCSRILSIINEAVTINELVSRTITGKDSGNNDIAAACKRYDVLYHIILEGSDGELLRLYSRSEIQQYIQDAMTVEGDENIEKRMRFEHDVFKTLQVHAEELIEYMKGLTL